MLISGQTNQLDDEEEVKRLKTLDPNATYEDPMGEKGFRRPGAMIAKLVDSELKTIAKKTGKSVEKLRADLLVQGGRKLNGR